jgi:DNA-binding MarR family transcriptional regulator
MMIEQNRVNTHPASGSEKMLNPERLEDMMDYRLYLLYRDCGYLTERLCKQECGINRRRWRIIATLVESEGSSVSHLAEKAELDIAQTSRTIGTMMREGYLRRLSNPENARFAHVILTDKGRSVYQSMFDRYKQANQRLLESLSPEEIAQLDGLIKKIRGIAQDLNHSIDRQVKHPA